MLQTMKAETAETTHTKKQGILRQIKEKQIDFIRLQFVDAFGFAKNVAITEEEIEKALDGELMFDGSSVDGFARVEESDMYLMPDLDTFAPVSYRSEDKGVAHMFCDVYGANRKPFEGCPRRILKNAIKQAELLGFELNVGPEGEFFLFHMDDSGNPIFDFHDEAGYFDLSPVDRGEDARRDIMRVMKRMGFSLEASHHEVASGQHEIDFKYDEALSTADKWISFKQIVKNTAKQHGLYASFIPKPFSSENGNAMHCNQSLFKDGVNTFYDPDEEDGISQIARYYIGGLLKHAKGMAAICNPVVNSYKRLIPGFEAPVNIGWSYMNRSSFIRIPNARGNGTRIELRTPDPTANPYLVFAVMLRAGLEGIKEQIEPPACLDYNMFDIQQDAENVQQYPRSLQEALGYMELDPLILDTLGAHTYSVFLKTKKKEWECYNSHVHEWEIKNYLTKY